MVVANKSHKYFLYDGTIFLFISYTFTPSHPVVRLEKNKRQDRKEVTEINAQLQPVVTSTSIAYHTCYCLLAKSRVQWVSITG